MARASALMVWLSTQASLFSRLRDPNDDDAWHVFDARYGDLVVAYCRSRGLQHTDAEDVRQLVMIGLVRAMRSFRYDPQRGRFRSYLGQAVRHAMMRVKECPEHAPLVLSDLDVTFSTPIAADAEWERQWRHHHLRQAMQALRNERSPRDVEVFELLLGGATAAQVATATGLSAENVAKIKQRVRARLEAIVASQLAEETAPWLTGAPTTSCSSSPSTTVTRGSPRCARPWRRVLSARWGASPWRRRSRAS